MDKQQDSFAFEEIEDVRIIIKANGKHYGLVAKKDTEFTEQEIQQIRIASLSMILPYHFVVDKPLEELNK